MNPVMGIYSDKRACKAGGICLIWPGLCAVQDPFELTHDLGRTVDRQTNGVLHKEFERAACVLRDHDNPLEKLMEPYRAGKTE